MTKKELYHLLHANGVPINVYKWDWSELPKGSLAERKFTPMLEDIDTFLKAKKSLILNFSNYLFSARIAATFLKAAYIEGYLDSYYTTPVNIVGYKKEQWDMGDAYDELLKSDFLVIDKVKSFPKTASDTAFPQATFDEFVQERLLRDRSTIFVATETPQFCFSEIVWGIMKELEVRIFQDGGVASAK
jgi:hypothetical protein